MKMNIKQENGAHKIVLLKLQQDFTLSALTGIYEENTCRPRNRRELWKVDSWCGNDTSWHSFDWNSQVISKLFSRAYTRNWNWSDSRKTTLFNERVNRACG